MIKNHISPPQRIKSPLFILWFILVTIGLRGQDTTIFITPKLFSENHEIVLSSMEGWVFKKGSDPSWADPGLNTADWDTLRPSNLSVNMVDETGKLEGWLRIKIKLSSDIDIKTLSFISRTWAAMDVFIDGKPLHSFGNTGSNDFPFTENNNFNNEFIHLQLEPQKEYLIALHIVDYKDPIFNKLKSTSYINLFTLADSKFLGIERMFLMAGSFISAVIATLALLFWFLYFSK
ncbi:MAG: hypothetical protein IPN29_00490 [Saprospiraceae bacterium]|nr:hypothetical protein [Saprospiraceae bacterium]